MKSVEIQPAEVITTRDFPVHSMEVLAKYFDMYRNGSENSLPPVPLMNINFFLPYFSEPELTLLLEFLSQNPDVSYFLLNGSHRTTAANLTRKFIRGMVLVAVEDIQIAREIKSNGKPYQHRLQDTIEENIRDLISHFRGTNIFQTVQQKTDKMVKQRVIPKYMIDYYNKDC